MSSDTRRRERRRTPPPRKGLSREAKILIGLGGALAGFAVIVLLLLARPGDEGADVLPAAVGDAQLIREDSWQAGLPSAPVTLVEFLDPECESCGAMYPIVERIREEYGDRINFVVRYFPLHFNSVLAVTAMEAAGEQGRYWEMYGLLFERQAEWGEQQTSQRAQFVEYATELGLDLAAFEAGLDNPAFVAKAERDQRDGVAFSVEGTPTFFLNGQMVGNMMTYEMLRDRIEQALQ